MLEAAIELFLTISAVFFMIVGVSGFAFGSSHWFAADVFGKPVKINGRKVLLGWAERREIALFVTVFGCFAVFGAWLFSNAWIAETLTGFRSLVPIWVFVLYALLLWLGISTYLNYSAGWPSLQRAFLKPRGKALAKHRLRWAMMGTVNYNNVLTIAAHRNGVGIEMNRLFGALTRPVLIPWDEVSFSSVDEAEDKLTKLNLGKVAQATLLLPDECWQKIECYRPRF